MVKTQQHRKLRLDMETYTDMEMDKETSTRDGNSHGYET